MSGPTTFRPRRARLWTARVVSGGLAAVVMAWVFLPGTYLDRTGTNGPAVLLALVLVLSAACLGRVRVELGDDGVTAVGAVRRVVVPWSLLERAHSGRQVGLAVRARGRGWVHLADLGLFDLSDLETIEQAVEDQRVARDRLGASADTVTERPPRALVVGAFLVVVASTAVWLVATDRSGWGGMTGAAAGVVIALLLARRQLRRIDRAGL